MAVGSAGGGRPGSERLTTTEEEDVKKSGGRDGGSESSASDEPAACSPAWAEQGRVLRGGESEKQVRTTLCRSDEADECQRNKEIAGRETESWLALTCECGVGKKCRQQHLRNVKSRNRS